MKIGSLFDGSGGFPLAAIMCGIAPEWASEVEPFPIAVTRSRFPGMKHLGSVTDVKGDEVEPVDVITFGSPCQDLSVAGKRAGLKHTENGDEETTRSGLFMEAIRIIKEMREATNGAYPRFAVWENVPGAFSSNKGEDFRIVLEEFIKVVEPTAVMPTVPKNGWPYADSYCGDGWSLSYRVLDAQFWGVPQRRRRIYLVADFRGQCAGKVSFEREGLRGHFAESGATWQATAGDAESGVGTADCELIPYTLKIRSGVAVDSAGKAAGKGALIQENKAATLAASQDQYLFQPMSVREENWEESPVRNALRAGESKSSHCVVGAVSIENHPADSRVNIDDSGKVQTLTGRMGTGGGNVPMVMEPVCSSGDVAGTLDASYFKGCGMRQGVEREYVVQPVGVLASSAVNAETTDGNISPCLMARAGTGGNQLPLVALEEYPVYCLQGNGIDRADTAGCNGKGVREDVCYTLNTIDRPAVAFAMQGFGDYKESDVASGLKARDYKDATDLVAEVAGVDCRNATEYPEMNGTLQAKSNGGFSYNCNQVVRVRYIVRRLTPTECARLQGFPDNWAHPDIKTELTDEEYAFWLNVRNTHATINGKAVKEYTRDQMLTWYNKLHTDSAEYKLWGNGIALPCALYVMQGIAEVLNESRN